MTRRTKAKVEVKPYSHEDLARRIRGLHEVYRSHTGAIAGFCEICGCDHTNAPDGWNSLTLRRGHTPYYDDPEGLWLMCDACTVHVAAAIDRVTRERKGSR